LASVTESGEQLMSIAAEVASLDRDSHAAFAQTFREQLRWAIERVLLVDVAMRKAVPSHGDAVQKVRVYRQMALQQTLQRHARLWFGAVLEPSLFQRAIQLDDREGGVNACFDIGDVATEVQETWEAYPSDAREETIGLIQRRVVSLVRESLPGSGRADR
jgi:hypothetical protein